jgi:hypothetical protein
MWIWGWHKRSLVKLGVGAALLIGALGIAPNAQAAGGFMQLGSRLLTTGGAANTELKTSVAISQDGRTALVGAPADDGGVGSAFVFVRSGSGWSQVAELLPSDESGAGQFGTSVALSSDGTTALIGGDEDNGGHGAAWVFTNPGTGWAQQGPKLVPNDETFVSPTEPDSSAQTPEFGESVALSGDGSTALIGDPADTCIGCGAAWSFTRSGTTWSQGGPKITPSDERIDSGYYGEGFGKAVALSANGQVALVGDPNNADGAGGGTTNADPGGAWVFDRSGATFAQAATIGVASGWPCGDPCLIDDPAVGSSVALSADGQTAIIGGTGAAEVVSGSQWTDYQILPGISQTIAAATLSGDGQTALLSELNGAVSAFARSGSTWTQQGATFSPTDQSGQEQFGSSLAISGDGSTAVVGGSADQSTGPFLAGPGFEFPTPLSAMWTFTDNYPVVSGASPADGSTAGGTVLKITGTNFAGATGVNFGAAAASSFTVASDGEIDAMSPAGAAVTVDVTVTGPQGVSPVSSADQFTYQGTTSTPSGPSAPGGTSAPGVPSAPGAVKARAGNHQATVSFQGPADNGSSITSYTVKATPGGAHATAASGPITVHGLRDGTRYKFTVAATNAVGVGPASAASAAVTPSAPTTVSGFRLAGLTASRPTLRLTVTAGTLAGSVRSVTIKLPRGLQPAAHPIPKIGVSPGGHRVKIHNSTLTITPTGHRTRLTIKLEPGALRETAFLSETIQRLDAYNRAKVHHLKKRLTVRTTLEVRTENGGRTQLKRRTLITP